MSHLGVDAHHAKSFSDRLNVLDAVASSENRHLRGRKAM